MSSRKDTILWVITAFVALVLLLATAGIALKAREQSYDRATVYLSGRGNLIYLRDRPNRTGRITAVLEKGLPAAIVDEVKQSGQTWYQVETTTELGWIQAQNISLAPP